MCHTNDRRNSKMLLRVDVSDGETRDGLAMDDGAQTRLALHDAVRHAHLTA